MTCRRRKKCLVAIQSTIESFCSIVEPTPIRDDTRLLLHSLSRNCPDSEIALESQTFLDIGFRDSRLFISEDDTAAAKEFDICIATLSDALLHDDLSNHREAIERYRPLTFLFYCALEQPLDVSHCDNLVEWASGIGYQLVFNRCNAAQFGVDYETNDTVVFGVRRDQQDILSRLPYTDTLFRGHCQTLFAHFANNKLENEFKFVHYQNDKLSSRPVLPVAIAIARSVAHYIGNDL
jgi:hypothetical protein